MSLIFNYSSKGVVVLVEEVVSEKSISHVLTLGHSVFGKPTTIPLGEIPSEGLTADGYWNFKLHSRACFAQARQVLSRPRRGLDPNGPLTVYLKAIHAEAVEKAIEMWRLRDEEDDGPE